MKLAYFSSAMRAVIVSACVLSSAGGLYAGLIDDNANDADHLALANLPQYDAVGFSTRFNAVTLQPILDSSAILIAPGWVLTAAHTEIARVPVPVIPNTFTVGGETRTIVNAFRHPSFTAFENGYDVALLQLDSPITTVAPAQLYTGTAASLIGQTLTYVGYGRTGTGSTGDTGAAGTKRAGNNVGDQLGFTLNPGPSEVDFSNQIIFADFDTPQGGPSNNPLGGTSPVTLEYLIALHDSGGGLFVEQNGEFFVAGVHSIIVDVNNVGTLGYGDIMGSTTLEQSLAWILETIAPEPIVGDLNSDGFVDILDLNIVLGEWNTDGSADPRADIDGNGLVDILDLNVVLTNWNLGTPPSLSGTSGLVPEPATLGLMVLAGAGATLRRRR